MKRQKIFREHRETATIAFGDEANILGKKLRRFTEGVTQLSKQLVRNVDLVNDNAVLCQFSRTQKYSVGWLALTP